MALFLLASLLLPSLSTSGPVPIAPAASNLPLIKLTIAIANNTPSIVTHHKRQGEAILPLDDNEMGNLYMVNIAIGTPPQDLWLQLDTGSSDTWVNPTCTSSTNIALCESYPFYNIGFSRTWADTGNPFSVTYGLGTAAGEYLMDDFTLGAGTKLNEQQFGYAWSTVGLNSGLLAVGPGMALTGYPTVIDSLVFQNIISSQAFSLNLGSVDLTEGSIIFGGIDTKKYSGPLEKLPIIQPSSSPDGFPRYWISLISIGITAPGSSIETVYSPPGYNQPVFVDSGSTFSRLPANIVTAIVSYFPGAYLVGSAPTQYYVVDCKYSSQDGTVDFGFGNTIIHVPFHQFIWKANGYCFLGVVATDADVVTWLLGDTFLRSAYIVVDQVNQNVLIANSADCGENLVPIGKGINAVPSIIGQCSASVKTVSQKPSSTSKSTSKSTAKATTTSTVKKTASTSSSERPTSTTTAKPAIRTSTTLPTTAASRITSASTAPPKTTAKPTSKSSSYSSTKKASTTSAKPKVKPPSHPQPL